MSEIIADPHRVGLNPTGPDVRVHSETELETAIARSQNYLFGLQTPEGYWVGELMVEQTKILKSS